MVERRCSIGCIMSADDEGNEPVAGLSAASACLVFSSSVSGSEEPAYRPVVSPNSPNSRTNNGDLR